MSGQFLKPVIVTIMCCFLSGASLCGCVLRTLTINSEPPGATVYLDDEPIGETPVITTFTYYGTRKVTLEKVDTDGRLLYERKIAYEKIKPPFYQILPLDFFSEILLPMKLKDEHSFTYQLDPLKQLPKQEHQEMVIQNAEELRERLRMPVAR